MILVLIKGSDAFRVDYEALERFVSPRVYEVDGLVPDPETFRAWVDSRSDTKATVF